MLPVSALGRERTEDCKFEASLSCTVRSFHKVKTGRRSLGSIQVEKRTVVSVSFQEAPRPALSDGFTL